MWQSPNDQALDEELMENFGQNHSHMPAPTDQLQPRRKTPRVGLSFDRRYLRPLTGVRVLWEDRSQTQVFDLSLTGLVLERIGVLKDVLARARQGSPFTVKLRFDGDILGGFPEERAILDLRVVELGEGYVSAMIDSIASDGRLKLPQMLKDQFVLQNFRLQDQPEQMARLHPDFSAYCWYHSVFDTNILLKIESGELKELLLEYDTLLLRYSSEAGVRIQKSFAMADLGQGYSHLWTQQQSQKVAMGASWAERLGRTLELAAAHSPQFAGDFRRVQNFLTALKEA